MEARVVKRTENGIWIEWSGRTGYGLLRLEYNGKGGYTIDGEYIGFETLFEIIQATDLNTHHGLNDYIPLTVEDLMDLDESEYHRVYSYCWHDGEARCDCIGISDVVIEKSEHREGEYNISWSDGNGDPNLRGYDLDTRIDNIGDGEWNYGLYIKPE